jgi:hypothetical protein
MNHRVTVGAERYEVIGWVNHVYTFEGVVGIHMMNLYEALTNVAVGFAKIETTADAADASVPYLLVVFYALAT